LNVDPTANAIAIAYESEHGGISISVTPLTTGLGKGYWIDFQGAGSQEQPGFWPQVFHTDHQPTCLLNFDAGPGHDRQMILGCRDGYLRVFSDTALVDDADDEVAIDSYVCLGPIRPGGNLYQQGMVRELIGTLDPDSADVTWSILSAATGAQVIDETVAKATGKWSAGRSHTAYPRVAEGSILVKLSSTGRWALESMLVGLSPVGRQRT
jgi:hypothetical protein